jgi:hypothetical protein
VGFQRDAWGPDGPGEEECEMADGNQPNILVTGEFLTTFREFPPRQKAASFTVDQVMDKLRAGITTT